MSGFCKICVGNLDIERGKAIAIGKDAAYYAEGAADYLDAARIQYFPNKEDFLPLLPKLLEEGDVVLIKASRGMKLEEIAARMMELKPQARA